MKTKSGMPRGTLSKELILQSALEIIDKEGLDGLSLRKIAAHLGVSTMSLYRHYRNKAEIEVDVVDHVIGHYDVAGHADKDWTRWIQTAYEAMRGGLCAHPGLMALLDNASLRGSYTGSNALQVMETVLQKLRDAGFSPEQAAQLFHMLMAYTIGSVVLMNQATRQATSGDGSDGDDAAEQSRMLKLGFEMVPIKQFPKIAEMAPHLASAWEAETFRAAVLHIAQSFAPVPAKPDAPRPARKKAAAK